MNWATELINATLARRRKRSYTATQRKRWASRKRRRYRMNPELFRAQAQARYHAAPEKHRERKRIEYVPQQVTERQNRRRRERYHSDAAFRALVLERQRARDRIRRAAL